MITYTIITLISLIVLAITWWVVYHEYDAISRWLGGILAILAGGFVGMCIFLMVGGLLSTSNWKKTNVTTFDNVEVVQEQRIYHAFGENVVTFEGSTSQTTVYRIYHVDGKQIKQTISQTQSDGE